MMSMTGDVTSLSLNKSTFTSFFNGQTGLKAINSDFKLPATTLYKLCYSQMFYGCTGFTSLPSGFTLPATTLSANCYQNMFYGCSNLNISATTGSNSLFTCPSTTGLTRPVTNMFTSTGGSFTGTPTDGSTYY